MKTNITTCTNNVNDLPILFGFKRYGTPKVGLFSVEKRNGIYSLTTGLEQEIKEYSIIGEDSTSYVYRLQPTDEGRYVGNKIVRKQFILPIGIHKSRLLKWKTSQLSMFDHLIN